MNWPGALLLLASLAYPSTGHSSSTLGLLSSPFDQNCPGCAGSNAIVSTNCPAGGAVGISVIVLPGLCTLQPECQEKDRCQVTITRTWSGITPDTGMKFCWEITPGGRKGCIDQPPPSSGPSGSGSDMNGPYELRCPQMAITYSITAECVGGTSVTAQANGSCGPCSDI